jgi:hypothetical protein
LNAANGQANRRRRRHLRSANRHHQNVVDRQLIGWAKVRVQVRPVVLKIFRRKVVARNLNVSDSALHRQLATVCPASPAENSERQLGYVIPGARLLRAELLAKHAAREKKDRALINLAGRREVERPLQVSAPQASQRVERKSQRKRHHHQGHNKF